LKRILISWIGNHDLLATRGDQLGPILSAIRYAQGQDKPYSALHFLYNYPEENVSPYRDLISELSSDDVAVSYQFISLSSPTNYAEIFPAAENALVELEQLYPEHQRTIHLSPGTPAMTAVWILLVKTRFPSICIDSWFERDTGVQHVNQVELPFEIDARFLSKPLLVQTSGWKLFTVAVLRSMVPFRKLLLRVA
jgi:hypothetical protein